MKTSKFYDTQLYLYHCTPFVHFLWYILVHTSINKQIYCLFDMIYGFNPIYTSCLNKFGNEKYLQLYDGYGYDGLYYVSSRLFECDKSTGMLLQLLLNRYCPEQHKNIAIDRLGYFGISNEDEQIKMTLNDGAISLMTLDKETKDNGIYEDILALIQV